MHFRPDTPKRSPRGELGHLRRNTASREPSFSWPADAAVRSRERALIDEESRSPRSRTPRVTELSQQASAKRDLRGARRACWCVCPASTNSQRAGVRLVILAKGLSRSIFPGWLAGILCGAALPTERCCQYVRSPLCFCGCSACLLCLHACLVAGRPADTVALVACVPAGVRRPLAWDVPLPSANFRCPYVKPRSTMLTYHGKAEDVQVPSD